MIIFSHLITFLQQQVMQGYFEILRPEIFKIVTNVDSMFIRTIALSLKIKTSNPNQ